METQTLHVRLYVDASCDSTINVPKGLTLEEAIAYAQEHMDEIPHTQFVAVPDSDEFDEADFDNEAAFYLEPACDTP